MASRESQGLQIALIISVFLIIALGVTTFVYYSKAERETSRATQLQSQVNEANGARDTAISKFMALKFMIAQGVVINSVDAGTDPMKQIQEQLETELLNIAPDGINDDEIKTIAQNYYKHMAAFGLDSDLQRNYSNLPDHLLQVVGKSNERIVSTQDEKDQLSREKVAITDQKTKEAEAFEQQAVKSQQDLQQEQVKFQDEYKRINTAKDQLKGDFDTRVAAIQGELDEARLAESGFQKQIQDLERVVSGQKTRIREMTTDSFESPDGRVSVVNHRLRVCYIDVGEADGLQRQQTFSVYDAGETAVMESRPKGRVEVIQLLDPHLALCKIISDQSDNLIRPGDVIHTPAWAPGRRVRFALAGFVDVDGDGISDKEKLLDIIRLNGGVVDDAVTPQTRYLIEGEPKSATVGAAEMSPQERNEFTSKVEVANQIGVDRVSVDKLLSYMGWKGDIKTVSLGKGDSNIDLKREYTGRESTGNNAFQRRSPPRGNNGAF